MPNEEKFVMTRDTEAGFAIEKKTASEISAFDKDTTLTQEGVAADAKAVGDAISGVALEKDIVASEIIHNSPSMFFYVNKEEGGVEVVFDPAIGNNNVVALIGEPKFTPDNQNRLYLLNYIGFTKELADKATTIKHYRMYASEAYDGELTIETAPTSTATTLTAEQIEKRCVYYLLSKKDSMVDGASFEFRLALVFYDENENEICRMYGRQFRFSYENGNVVVTRRPFTDAENPAHIYDMCIGTVGTGLNQLTTRDVDIQNKIFPVSNVGTSNVPDFHKHLLDSYLANKVVRVYQIANTDSLWSSIGLISG